MEVELVWCKPGSDFCFSLFPQTKNPVHPVETLSRSPRPTIRQGTTSMPLK